MAEKKDTQIVTGVARLSYANIDTPRLGKNPAPTDKPKYGCAILIPKTDTKTIEKYEAAVDAAIKAGIKKLTGAGGKPIPKAKLKLPLRDGDLEGKPEYDGMWFFNANSATKPGIIDLSKNRVETAGFIYSGCYARVSVNFYAFDGESYGVAAGLNNIQKVKDGERLGGGTSAEDDFDDDFEVDIDDADDLI